jgi:hypothetical protein
LISLSVSTDACAIAVCFTEQSNDMHDIFICKMLNRCL